MDERFLRQAELHLRLHLHGLVPLHESLVDAMCRSKLPPLELATTIEDIGQRYLKMAEVLNGEIIGRDMIDAEPEDADDFAEAKIDSFTADLIASAGIVVFHDGIRVDGSAALNGAPAVMDAVRSAILIERSRRGTPLRSVT